MLNKLSYSYDPYTDTFPTLNSNKWRRLFYGVFFILVIMKYIAEYNSNSLNAFDHFLLILVTVVSLLEINRNHPKVKAFYQRQHPYLLIEDGMLKWQKGAFSKKYVIPTDDITKVHININKVTFHLKDNSEVLLNLSMIESYNKRNEFVALLEKHWVK